MKFIVRHRDRTADQRPCNNAVMRGTVRHETFTSKDNPPDWWFAAGANHVRKGDRWLRDWTLEWEINIDSITDVYTLLEEIYPNSACFTIGDIPTIEIGEFGYVDTRDD